MKQGLLVVERMILESIGNGEKSAIAISEDTGLNHGIVLNSLQNLLLCNLVNFSTGHYTIDHDEWVKQKEKINSSENVKLEMRTLFTSMVNRYFKKDGSTKIRYRKIYLNADEETTYNQLLKNLDQFMVESQKRRVVGRLPAKLGRQKVVIFGETEYSGVVNDIIRAV